MEPFTLLLLPPETRSQEKPYKMHAQSSVTLVKELEMMFMGGNFLGITDKWFKYELSICIHSRFRKLNIQQSDILFPPDGL